MNHEQIRELLSEYFDNELPKFQREEIRQHLDSCALCRTQLEQWHAVARSLVSSTTIVTPQETKAFISKIMDRLHPIEKNAAAWWEYPDILWRKQSWTPWLAPALSLGFAVLTLLFVGRQEASSDPVDILARQEFGGNEFTDWLSQINLEEP